jgi:putative ABC transport system permease protein
MSQTRTPSVHRRQANNGGWPSRRVVIRLAWRLFRREWRQQLLILALIVVAVGATILGSAVATNTPPPANSGFGTAQDAATFPGSDPQLAAQVASLEHRFGRVEVIGTETLPIPGSVYTYQVVAQNPHGPYGQPMLSLVSGHYPAGAGQVAMTATLASDFNLIVGDVWHHGGTALDLVGIVENPQSLLDNFALVAPGELKTPTQITVLFDGPGVQPSSIGPNVSTPASVVQHNPLDPETLSLAVLTIGMLLIALVAVGGFTVLAQRRLRSLGMLASIGATDKRVGLVVRANGLVVGLVGAVIGALVGFAAWLAYRPALEQDAHHLVGVFQLPWLVVAAAIALAIVATYFAASRPARAITRLPVIAALSGRPAPPKQVHRSALPGIVFLVIAFLLLGYAGSTIHGQGSAGMPELVLGIVALIPAVILLSPFLLTALARLGRHTPVAARLALRDLARYRARSGSALAAISLGVMIAVIIMTAAAARYGNVFDPAGPNLASNEVAVWPNVGPNGPTAGQLRSEAKIADTIGVSLGAKSVVTLETTSVGLQRGEGPNERSLGESIYVATPQLLRAFGISASQVNPEADILTVLGGLSGASGIDMSWCKALVPQGEPGNFDCTSNGVLKDPVIQGVGSLPSGVHGPNTVITEHAIGTLSLESSIATQGWLIEAAQPLTAAQIHNVQAAGAAAGVVSVETKNDEPTSSEVVNWATLFGILMALCILAMSVGLIRSETAGDLRTLAATGASGYTRRTLTAATAGALALLGAILGTLAGYVGMIGFLRGNSLNGGISSLGNVPVANLLVILVGMPFVATLVGWLLAGRQLPAMAHQTLE